MTERNTSNSMYGSYVQLSTFDDRQKPIVERKSSFTRTQPFKRFLITRRDVVVVVIVLVLAFIIIATTLSIGLPKIREKRLKYWDTSFPISGSPLKFFSNAVVLTDGQPCAEIGKNILNKGGSAVDAAVAALFCNGVVNPQSTGIGGGFLMVVYNRETGTSEVIDARETAPLASTKHMFNGNSSLSLEGGLSVGVPGEIKGYWLAHEKYGKLNWSDIVEPSVTLCEKGFLVSQHLAYYLRLMKEKILADASMREEFYNNKTNDVYKEGETLMRPVLGNTLKAIAQNGSDILYSGELGKKLVEDIQKCGGKIVLADLEQYEAKSKPSVITNIRDGPDIKSLHTVPPPGSGLILALILNILDGYNFTTADMEDIDTATLAYHRIIEAFKYSFAYRTRLGDDEFVNITKIVADLKSREFAKTIQHRISDTMTYEPEHYQPLVESAEDHGTAQVSVSAPNGDAVSATSTINTYFGSMCRSQSTGIILNNAMNDFASPNITNYFGLPPSPANYIVPKKKPLSSMCPSILVNADGQTQLIIGGAGGTRIITAIAQSMIRVLWLRENTKEATDALRIHHQLVPNKIQYEKYFPKIYLDKLEKYGHITEESLEGSVVLAISRKDGLLEANVDYRKGGSADGF